MRPKRVRNLFRRAPGLPGWAALATSGKAATSPRPPSWPAATRTWSDLAPSRKWKCSMTPIAAALGEWLAPATLTCDSPTSRWRTDPGGPPDHDPFHLWKT